MTIARLRKKKHNDFVDAWFKALMVGGSYYLSRKFHSIMVYEKIEIASRYQLFIEVVDRHVKRSKWGFLHRWFIGNACHVLACFLTIDNAYGTAFDRILKDYEKEKKKRGFAK